MWALRLGTWAFICDAVARIASSIQRTDSVDYDFHYRDHKGWGLREVQYPSDRWIPRPSRGGGGH
jgi:hypothetical protein